MILSSLALAFTIIGHSHNDYWQKRPFYDAYESGLRSFEADVFVVGDDLWVGHEKRELVQERTLDRLYLDPMEKELRGKSGYFLLVDVKEEGVKAVSLLEKKLSVRPSLLKSVKVIVSGDRPIEVLKGLPGGLMFIDGRLSDLDDPHPAYAWISDNWRQHFRWIGIGKISPEESNKLRGFVEKSRAKGRSLRFWGAPDNPVFRAALKEHGVDVIGTDKPSDLGAWLRTVR